MRLERVDMFRWRDGLFKSTIIIKVEEMLANGTLISANARDITAEEREQLVGYLLSLAERVRGAT
jgi:hypothetical protein